VVEEHFGDGRDDARPVPPDRGERKVHGRHSAVSSLLDNSGTAG
jgi:hypothetical protein